MTTSSFEIKNLDLNTLFNFSFNFEMLKQTIEYLITNQKLQNEKIQVLEGTLGINTKSSEFTDKEIEANIDPEKKEDEKTGSKGFLLRKETMRMKNSGFEYKDKVDVSNINDFIEYQSVFVKNQFEIHLNEIKELNRKYEELNTNLEEINSKVSDFNFFDLLKNKNTSIEGNFESGGDSINLIQMVEKKFTKKFEMMNETSRKKEDEMSKIKYDVINIKSFIEKFEKINQLNNEKLEFFNSANDGIKNLIKKEIDNIDVVISNKLNSLNEFVQSKFQEHEQTFLSRNIVKIEKCESDQKDSNNNTAMEFSKDINKKIQEIQKAVKVLNSNNNVDILRAEVIKLQENLNSKTNQTAFSELKDNYLQSTSQIEFLKEQLALLLEDKKVVEEVTWLRKRVDTLSLNILNLKSGVDENANMNNSPAISKMVDTSKYLEINTFNDYVKSQSRENDNIKYLINSTNIELDQFKEVIITKANEKDVKFLEEYILNRIEDIKVSCTKKFADKIETSKNIKYLNTELKHIVDVYIKKMEKGDNWLIAKKPLEGYKCGSCESYIGGELADRNSYIPWNKMQQKKDSMDKNYNVGNGFSRMVQILNLDTAINKNKNNSDMQTSNNDFFVNLDMENGIPNLNNKNALPKIPNHQKHSSVNINTDMKNISFEANEEVETVNTVTDPHQPRVVKIYKKNKKQSDKQSDTNS